MVCGLIGVLCSVVRGLGVIFSGVVCCSVVLCW